MADILSAVSTVIDTAKKLRKVSEKMQDAETKNLVADLNLELADLKSKIADLQEENMELQEKVSQFREAKQLRSSLELRNDVYYITDQRIDRPSGPYCTRCFNYDQELTLVTGLSNTFKRMGNYKCPERESVY